MKKCKKIERIVLGSLGLVIAFTPTAALAANKNETVYSVLDKEGKSYKTQVTTHLYGELKDETEDETLLKNIMNLSGKEKFTLNDRCLIWENKGKEIYYKGETSKELPIETNVKYYLDEKEISAKDLQGKSGRVTIEFNFVNKEKHGNLYTPFVVTLGTILNDKNISEVKITNGKIVKSGNKNIVIGLSSPGLYSSLNIQELESLDKIVLSYTTKEYKNNTFYLVSTPKILEKKDLEIFNRLENTFSNVGALKTNIDKLEQGSVQILSELEKKIALMSDPSYAPIDEETMSKIKTSAINTVNESLKEQESSIKQQASSSLNSSLNPDNIALKALTAATGNEQLAKSIINNTNKCSNSTTSILKNDILVLDPISDANYQAIVLGIAKDLGYITADTPQAAYPQILTALAKELSGIDDPAIAAKSIALMLVEGCDSYNTASLVSGQIKSNISGQVPSAVYNAVTSAASEVAENVSVAVASNVADSFVKETVASLNTLKAGLQTLTDGISTYNKEGITPLVGYASSINNYSAKLKKLAKLSEDYKGYGSENSDSTTFVSVIK